jgi:hypothetical protein
MDNEDLARNEVASCEPGLSRKGFIELVLKRALGAGVVLAAPKIVDKFLIPPAYATISTGGASVSM